MTYSSNLVLWFLTSLLNAGGVIAAPRAWNTYFSKRHARLVWLVPSLLFAAWLASLLTLPSLRHHAEILGDSAIVLLTRTKDLGNGWEPLFYTLLWKRDPGAWRLQREIVHQKSSPNWT